MTHRVFRFDTTERNPREKASVAPTRSLPRTRSDASGRPTSSREGPILLKSPVAPNPKRPSRPRT